MSIVLRFYRLLVCFQTFRRKMENAEEKVEPVVVPVHVLPEFVTVETLCITPQYASENNIEDVLTISKQVVDFIEKVKSGPSNATVNGHTSTPSPAITATKPKMMEQGTMTTEFHKPGLIGLPQRMREVQTEGPIVVDVGIQCEADDLEDCWANVLPDKSSMESNATINSEMEFLSYVNQHTELMPNGMLECCVCGEISNYQAEHQRHMTLHFGPTALCSRCGTIVEHKHLLSQHSYNCPARYRCRSLPKWHIQCPHLHCNFVVKSKEQLARHLKKHVGAKAYYCLECRKSFTSSTHFLVHRLMESTCRDAKHIYLASNTMASAKTMVQRCTVCMRRFINSERCESHKRRCIRKHYKRQEILLMTL